MLIKAVQTNQKTCSHVWILSSLLHCNSVLPRPMCRSVLNIAMWEKFEQVFLVVGSSLGTACCLIYSAAQHLGCCPGCIQAALELPQVEVESWCIDMALGSVDLP